MKRLAVGALLAVVAVAARAQDPPEPLAVAPAEPPAAATAAPAAPPAAEDEEVVATEIEALVRDGHYDEAVEVARSGEGEPQAGFTELARALLGFALESDDSYVRWFALRAAQPLNDPALAPHARRALGKGDRYDKSLALDVLIGLDPAGNREHFLSALDSPFRSIRLRGLMGLAEIRDPVLAERFTEVISKDPDPDLRAFAVRALARTGSPQAPAGLYRALDDGVPAVQEEAVVALASLRSPGLTAVLRHRLNDAAPEDRSRALQLAGLVHDAAMIQEIAPFLGDPDPEVRAYAAAAILAISERNAATPGAGEGQSPGEAPEGGADGP